jgi:hypothetical protein
MKLQRKLGVFKCPKGESGCFTCRPMEKIVKGEAELVGVGEFKHDIYILSDSAVENEFDSEIL